MEKNKEFVCFFAQFSLSLQSNHQDNLSPMEFLKKYLLDILAVVIFAVISFAYFFPADLEGRILFQHDSSAGRGAG